MRLRVESHSQAESVSVVIIGRWLWRCCWPGFDVTKPGGGVPSPPMPMTLRLGYMYIGMLMAENNMSFDEIYEQLLLAPLGKDVIDNIKITPVQRVAYMADRVAAAATQEPGMNDPAYFGTIKIPVLELYVDLEATPDVCA